MWPFRRRRDTDEATTPASAEAPSDVVARATPATEAWRTAPPIQPTIGPAPHTYRTDDIGEILTSWNSPRLSGEMGHQVSADAPSGVLHDMATTVETDPGATLPASTETGVLRESPHDHRDHDRPADVIWSSSSSAAGLPGQAGPTTPAIPPAAGPVGPLVVVVGDEGVAPSSDVTPWAQASVGADQPPPDADSAGAGPPSSEHLVADGPALRTLAASDAPVPTVSRITAPEVVAPRRLPTLAVQRAADTASPSPTASAASRSRASEALPTLTRGDGPTPKVAEPTGPTVAFGPVPPVGPTEPPRPRPTTLPPGAVLGPPIQPRAVQRRTIDLPLPPVHRDGGSAAADAGPAPAPGAAPTEPGSAALESDGPQPRSQEDSPTPAAASPSAAVTAASAEDHMSAPQSHSHPVPDEAAMPDAPLAGESPPLAARPPDEHFAGDGHDHSDDLDADQPGGSGQPAEGPSLPLQRQVAPSTSTPTSPPVVRPVGLGEPLAEAPVSPTTPAAAPPATAVPAPGSRPAPLPLSAPPVQRLVEDGGGTSSSPSIATAASTPTDRPGHDAVAPSPLDPRPTDDPPAEHEEPAVQATETAGLVGDRSVAATEAMVDPTGEPGDDAVETTTTAGPPDLTLATPPAPAPPPAAPITVATLGLAPLVLQRTLDEGPPTVLHSPPDILPTPVAATIGPTPLPSGTLRAAGAGTGPALQRTILSTQSMPGRTPSVGLSPGAPGQGGPALTLAAAPPVAPASWPDPGAIAVANGVAQRMPDGSVQFTVQRESSSVRDRVASCEERSGAAAAPASGGPSITATASAAPEAPPAAGNEREQLEEQARKLWPLIRRKLNNELESGPKGRRPGW